MATATKPRSKKVASIAEKKLNSWIQNEIYRLSELHGVDKSHFEDFAKFVIENQKKTELKPPKPPTLAQLKSEIFQYFNVTDLKSLKLLGAFKIATNSIEKIDLSKRPGWEILYRKFIGVLPNEENEQGYGCLNGINIFKYDMPWRAFGLDSKTATNAQVKTAYYNLSKIYHPDNQETGDVNIFDRLTIFYKSLTEKF
jgi:hypothetical protein